MPGRGARTRSRVRASVTTERSAARDGPAAGKFPALGATPLRSRPVEPARRAYAHVRARGAAWLRRRVAPRPAPRPVASPIRLVGLLVEDGGVRLDVQVGADPLLREAPFRDAPVRVGVHLLGEGDVVVEFDGPRSDDLSTEWLDLRPVTRCVDLTLPPGSPVVGVQIDLVIEGIAWGSEVGIPPIVVRFAAPGVEPRFVAPRGAVTPWPEPFAVARDRLTAVRPEGSNATEMAVYARSDAARFLVTAAMAIEAEPETVLEIGSNPYFTTLLLRQARPDWHLSGTNWNGAPGPPLDQALVDHEGRVVLRATSDLVDVEADALPHPDGSLDLVLFCEVVEHLVADPVFALREIHRVLRPGGRLLLTTPNVSRADNVRHVVEDRSIYDPYSGYGPHGRHNREYDARELFDLLTGNGFTIDRHLTRRVHGVVDLDAAWWAGTHDDGRGDYHLVDAVRADPLPPYRPGWLYR
jgi:SAM-dependent methyltransferase